MKNITIRIEEDMIEEIKKQAEKDGRSISSYLRKILKENTKHGR